MTVPCGFAIGDKVRVTDKVTNFSTPEGTIGTIIRFHETRITVDFGEGISNFGYRLGSGWLMYEFELEKIE